MPAWVVALFGVIVGFVLNEMSKFFKDKSLSKKLKEALEDEMNANFYQLDQKIDIANQMKNALNQNSFLPGISVPFASSVFDHHFPSILKDLSPIQRDNIRHIYSNLRLLDKIIISLEKSYKEDFQEGALADTNAAYIGKIDDVLNNYKALKDLITSYLDGSPNNIYYRSKSNSYRDRTPHH